MSAVLLVFPGHFQHAVWHDLESFIHVLHWMCLRFHMTNYSTARDLRNHVRMLYTDAYRGVDGVSYGGDIKLRTLLAGRIPFQLQNGSVGRRKGLHPLLAALSKLYGEHYAWLKAQSMLPTKGRSTNTLSETDAAQGTQGAPKLQGAKMVMPSVLSELLEDTANDPDVVQPPPSASAKMPEPVLDYRHVKRAFVQTLFPEHEWIDDPKSAMDGFAQFA